MHSAHHHGGRWLSKWVTLSNKERDSQSDRQRPGYGFNYKHDWLVYFCVYWDVYDVSCKKKR